MALWLQFFLFFVPVCAFFFSGKKIQAWLMTLLYAGVLVAFELYIGDVLDLIFSSLSGLLWVVLTSTLITAIFVGFYFINQKEIKKRLEDPRGLKKALILTMILFALQNIVVFSGISRSIKEYSLVSIKTQAMIPMIYDSDIIMSKEISPSENISRGDTILFELPLIQKFAVGVVFALPGDEVVIKVTRREPPNPGASQLSVNGQTVFEYRAEGSNKMQQMERQILPDPCYFVVAVNYRQSYFDSLNLGCVEKKQLKKRLLYVLWAWPPRRIGATLTLPK